MTVHEITMPEATSVMAIPEPADTPTVSISIVSGLFKISAIPDAASQSELT